jgi:hypothetical protein
MPSTLAPRVVGEPRRAAPTPARAIDTGTDIDIFLGSDKFLFVALDHTQG